MTHYVIDPMGEFPKRWRDKHGLIEVMMSEPVKGWLMCRRVGGGAPFCLRVSHLCNAERHPVHGPFEYVEPKRRTKRTIAPAIVSETCRHGQKGSR